MLDLNCAVRVDSVQSDILYMHNIFSVRFQDLISQKEAQEESHPKAADSGVYTGKHTFAHQQSYWILVMFQYPQKPINHWNSLLQWNKGHRIMKKWPNLTPYLINKE